MFRNICNGNQEYILHIKCNDKKQVKMITNTLHNMFKEVTMRSSKQDKNIKLFHVKDRKLSLYNQMGGAVYFTSMGKTDTSLYIIAHFAHNSRSLVAINSNRSLITTVTEPLPHLTLFDLHLNHQSIIALEMLKRIMPGIANRSCPLRNQIGPLTHIKYAKIGVNPYIVDEYQSSEPHLTANYELFKRDIVNFCSQNLFDVNISSLNSFIQSSTNPLFHVHHMGIMAFAEYYKNLLKLHISLSSVDTLKSGIGLNGVNKMTDDDINTLFSRKFDSFKCRILPSEWKYIEVSIVNNREGINYHYLLNCELNRGQFYIKGIRDRMYLLPDEIYTV